MLGRLCTVSANANQTDFSHEDSDEMRGGLLDDACQDCGVRQYHLVFRVEALSDRVTLSVVCDVCSGRMHSLENTHDPHEQNVAGRLLTTIPFHQ